MTNREALTVYKENVGSNKMLKEAVNCMRRGYSRGTQIMWGSFDSTVNAESKSVFIGSSKIDLKVT